MPGQSASLPFDPLPVLCTPYLGIPASGAGQMVWLEILTGRNRLHSFPTFARGDQATNPSRLGHDDRPRRSFVVGEHFKYTAAAGEADGNGLFLVGLRQMRQRAAAIGTTGLI